MSSHLRHCPKHKKPLPCSHCALTVKCIACDRQTPNLGTKLCASPDCIEAREQRKKLAVMGMDQAEKTAVPNPSELRKPKVEIETSVGSVRTNAEDSDRATEQVFEKDAENRSERDKKKTTRTKKLVPAVPVPEAPLSQRVPAFLKSIAIPVVPSADPEAPFGRDAHYRPILPGRSDQEIVDELKAKDFLAAGTCPHKSRPDYCLLCGTSKFTITRAEPLDLEERLRQMFGIPVQSKAVRIEREQFNYFPQILGITRGQLIGLLHLDCTIEPRPVKKTVLKSRIPLKTRIAQLLLIPKQIEKRKALVRKSEELIESLSVRVMKLRRAEENILDKPTREQFKRKERVRIFRSKDKIQELRRQHSGLPALQQRLTAWGSGPNDFETITATENAPIKFAEKFTNGSEVNRFRFGKQVATETILGVGRTAPPEQIEFAVETYVALLDEYGLLKDVSRRLPQFLELDKWRHFENAIIFQAISWGLVRPTKQMLAKYPELKIGPPTTQVSGDPEFDETENLLILKTEGAAIGGGIYGSNTPGAPQMKTFEKYDKNRRRGAQFHESVAGPHNFFGDLDSGDLDERAADE